MVRKKTLLILGAIVCAAALAVTGVFAFPPFIDGAKGEESKPSQPDELTALFFTMVGEKKYEEIYSLLTAESKARISPDDFLTKYKNIYGGIEAKNITVDVQQVSDYNGTERDAKTLSGGESFIAALSLALGLSDEIQENAGGIRLDSMFVDEGFDSLDDTRLSQAMQALMSISQTNRLIGIISHVSGLEEKIDRRIDVTKDRTGGSKAELIVN